MTTEHDFDGHGGCVPDCRQCRIEEQAATIARLEGELAQRREDFRIQNSEIVRCHDERDALTARVAAALGLIVEAQHKGQSDDPDVCHVTQAWFDDLTAALKEHP